MKQLRLLGSMLRRSWGWLLSLVAGLLLGWFGGFGSIFELFFLVAGAVLVVLAFLALKAIALLFRSAVLRWRPLGQVLLAAVVAVIVSGSRLTARAGQRRQRAESAVAALLTYHRQHGQYPAELAEIGPPPATEELDYYPDGAQQQFRLSVRVDDWHFYAYDSQTGHWSSGD